MAVQPPGAQGRDDPRPPPSDRGAPSAGAGALRPVVAGAVSGSSPWIILGAAALLGLAVLLFLVSRRHEGASNLAAAVAPTASTAAEPPPADLALIEAQGRGTGLAAQQTQPVPMPVAPPPIPQARVGGPVAAAISEGNLAPQRLRAPSLVVDLDAGSTGAAAAGSGAGEPAANAERVPGQGGQAVLKGAPTQLNGDEQFAERIGSSEPDHARATILGHPRTVVPQGTMIPAVLETAMNSDLPGFVRALVSRDVRSFDGSSVLIPRGSRLVGQYRSGLSQGASRIFVIWTRVLRSDGVSVQIASPGGDPLGRAGQEGKVHSHFFRQFADSILLSVINAEVTNLAAQPSTQIVIGGAATGLTSSATPSTVAPVGGATTPTAPTFPPTITVLQGAPISIFVARDLDFSGVQGLPK